VNRVIAGVERDSSALSLVGVLGREVVLPAAQLLGGEYGKIAGRGLAALGLWDQYLQFEASAEPVDPSLGFFGQVARVVREGVSERSLRGYAEMYVEQAGGSAIGEALTARAKRLQRSARNEAALAQAKSEPAAYAPKDEFEYKSSRVERAVDSELPTLVPLVVMPGQVAPSRILTHVAADGTEVYIGSMREGGTKFVYGQCFPAGTLVHVWLPGDEEAHCIARNVRAVSRRRRFHRMSQCVSRRSARKARAAKARSRGRVSGRR